VRFYTAEVLGGSEAGVLGESGVGLISEWGRMRGGRGGECGAVEVKGMRGTSVERRGGRGKLRV
jgi:hypothetical protein